MKILGKVLAAISVAMLAFAAGIIYAQDVMKVASDTHSVLLENDQVRVLKVVMKPGQKAVMHSHPHNVGYYLTDAKVKITLPDGKSMVRDLKAGSAGWSEAATHEAENVGSTTLEEIQVELKK